MVKYLIFSSVYFYPDGGMKDCIGKSMSLEGVIQNLRDSANGEEPGQMYHVYDIENNRTFLYESELEFTPYSPEKATKESIEKFLDKVRKDIAT